MNLQELAKKHNLKAGDKVLCTYSNVMRIGIGEYFIHRDRVHNCMVIKDHMGLGCECHGCKFELLEKKRHIHADLINWWAECPSENEIQVKAINSDWVTVTSPSWYAGYEYRKKPTATELKINELFDSSIDALHGIANEINELKRTSK